MKGELEAPIQAAIRGAVCALGWARLRRNMTGETQTPWGGYLRYGLGKGGADLVGWVTLPSGIARVLCIEVKRAGERPDPDQVRWLSTVNKHGGAAAVCRSAETAVAFAERARAGEFFTGAGPHGL